MVDFEEQKAAARVKSISINKNKEVKFLKRKQSYDNSMANGGVALAFDYNQFSQKSVDEDTTNRSSSGSAMSNSDAQFGSADVSDLTGQTLASVDSSSTSYLSRMFNHKIVKLLNNNGLILRMVYRVYSLFLYFVIILIRKL